MYVNDILALSVIKKVFSWVTDVAFNVIIIQAVQKVLSQLARTWLFASFFIHFSVNCMVYKDLLAKVTRLIWILLDWGFGLVAKVT